jgi:hypothetical protein
MRRGWEVYSARPDADGVFTISGPPGRYRLEYLRIGELAEFVVPHEVEARAGRLTCLGTLEVVVGDMTQDLGNNTASNLRVRDDCATIEPQLRRVAGGGEGGGGGGPVAEVKTGLARPVPPESKLPGVLDVLVAFRGEVAFNTQNATSLRVDFVLPLGEESDHGNWLVAASAIHVSSTFVNDRWPAPGAPPPSSVWGGSVGAGYNIWALEALASAGYLADPGRGAHGPLAGLSLRLGNFLWGFGGRVEFYPSTGDRVASLTLDVSPFGLLGALL